MAGFEIFVAKIALLLSNVYYTIDLWLLIIVIVKMFFKNCTRLQFPIVCDFMLRILGFCFNINPD